jgi:choline kinase
VWDDLDLSNFVFVVGWNHTELIPKLPLGSATIINQDWETTNTSYSLKCALDRISGDIMIINGDVIAESSCFRSVSVARQSAALVDIKQTGQEEVKYSLTNKLTLTNVGKTADPTTSCGEVLGINKVIAEDRVVFDKAVSNLKPTDFYDLAFNHIPVYPVFALGRKCVEIDTPEDLEHARRIFT